ncbi:type II toxin-antitoxin system RelE/ParE family toxin [Geminocystis sp. CENA526]|uniref:type II toxin-antitoxin system RelE/ParE family toxin n=1 Tax=Geminocystis sp. CENA526 TaxID=1355871 RepID=UPI003D6E91B9
MGTYSFSEEAVKDLKEICDSVAKINPQYASNLFDAIRNKSKLIANFPNLGKNYYKLKPNLKGFLVDDYVIFYYPQSNGIIITRVINGYRDLEKFFSE